MKLRIRFTKHGAVRYIGHLDMQRFFQRANRRADIKVVYSEGFSPHQKMSFAMPLSVGYESDAEYFDLEVAEAASSEDVIRRLNEQMTDGIEVTGCVLLPDDSENAMASVRAADYTICFREGYVPPFDISKTVEDVIKDEAFTIKKPVKKKKANSSSLVICLILIAVLLATTIGALIYGVKQHNQYVKVNTENVQLKANEDKYKKEIADKDATIANLTAQINNQGQNSGDNTPSQGKLVYKIGDGPLHFRVSPTSDADATTYNGASLANNGEEYNVIEIVNDKDLGDQVKWAKLADNIYFCVDDNGNVYAKKS